MRYIQYLNHKIMDKSCQICIFYETSRPDIRITTYCFCGKGDERAHYLYHCNLFELGMSKSMKEMEVTTCSKEINMLKERIKELEKDET